VYTLKCIEWLENVNPSERTGCFLELVTGFNSENIEESPILVGKAGVVIYNDFDVTNEPEKMKYFKFARGSAYLGDELVEHIEGSKPRCVTPQFGDVDLLPIDMTPTDVKLAFQRDVGTSGLHKITVTMGESRSSILNAAGAIQIWSDLVIAIVQRNDLWEGGDENEMEDDENEMEDDESRTEYGESNEDNKKPLEPRKVQVYSPVGIDPENFEGLTVAAQSFQNPRGRCIACCAMREPQTTFLVVDGKHETFKFAGTFGAISAIVY
jgi:hypothetical protein